MLAAVLIELNRPLMMAEVKPCELAFGQVRVRMLASGICGAQLAEIRGEKGNAKFLPHLMGHEGCGIVEEVGPAVTRVKAGDKVVLHWRKAGGIESPFPRYQFDGRVIQSGKVVTFAEEVIASENRVTPVPQDTPRGLAALLGCGLSTALATLQHEADFAAGESLLVIGAGGLGINLLRAAQLFHAEPVACVDVHENKRAMVEVAGASYHLGEFPREKFDVVIDTVGLPATFSGACRALAPSGRLVMIGQPKHPLELPSECDMFAGEGKTIKATQGGGFQPDRDIPRWLKLWRKGTLKVEGIVTHSLPLAQANDAIDLVRFGNAGRVLLTMGV